MSAPAITLTANAQDFTGASVGSAGGPSKLAITLCGFGALLPRIPGTSVLFRPGPIYIESANGAFSTPLWGNDVITPNGTYYTIALLDAQGNVVQCGAYQLTGGGTFDLSQLTPMSFPGQGITVTSVFFQGIPAFQLSPSTVNGVNTVFTFTAPASPTPTLAVFAGGIFQSITNADYSLAYAGSSIWNITFAIAPTLGPVAVLLFAQGSGGAGITQLTGDVAAGPGTGSQAATLATVNSAPGSFTNSNITVNAKGLVTAASTGSGGGGGGGTFTAELVAFSGTAGALANTPITVIGFFKNGQLLTTLGSAPDYSITGPGAITLTVAAGGSDVYIALYYH
jgi:hypothetical protein